MSSKTSRRGTVPLISELLAGQGFRSAGSVALARAALEEAGLTRAGKTGISADKLDRVQDVLRAKFARYCGRDECSQLLSDDPRELVVVEQPACEVCGGSNNQRAVREMADACRHARVAHVLIVGGTPRLNEALANAVGSALPELRFVVGTEKEPNLRAALQDCNWADLVVVWGPSPLPHKVSRLYAREVCGVDRVEVRRRGVEALAGEVSRHLGRQGRERVRSP